MTVFEFAFYRSAAQRMTVEELQTALALAEKADAGNASAAATLRSLCERIVRRKTEVNASRLQS
jgi:hypothetical protein